MKIPLRVSLAGNPTFLADQELADQELADQELADQGSQIVSRLIAMDRHFSIKYFLAAAFQIDVLYKTHSDDKRRSSLMPYALVNS
jgi:hypothetical protein